MSFMRKNVIRLLSLGILAVMLINPAITQAQKIVLKGASAWEKQHANNDTYHHVINVINQRAQGRLEIRWVGGPETIKAVNLPDAVRDGTVDLFYSAPAYYAGMVPESFFTYVPFGYTKDNARSVWHDGVHEIVDKAWQKKGYKVLDMASLINFYFFTKKPITKLIDFKGKTLRVTGGIHSFLPSYLGGASSKLASAEVYAGIERGVIDGGLQPLSSYAEYQYWEVAPYIVDHPITNIGAWYWMSLDRFNKLPSDLQKILLDAIHGDEDFLISSNIKLESDDRNQIQKKGGKFISFSSEDEKEFRKNLAKTRDNVLKECPETGKALLEVLDKYSK